VQTRGADVDAARDAFITAWGDRAIEEVRAQGLVHTRMGVIRQWLAAERGQPLSRFRAGAAWENLSRLGIFSAVDIDFSPGVEGGVDITVTVEEKWTLYPVPMLLFYEDTQLGGLIVADSNAFGYNKGWAVGGVYSNRGWYALAAYVDPNIAFTNFYGRLSLLGGSGLLENDTPAGTDRQTFNLDRFDAQYSLGYTIGGRFSPTWTGAFRHAHVGDVMLAGPEPPQDGTVISQGVKLIWNDRRTRSYYEKGLRSSIEYQHGFSVGGNDASFDNLISETSYTTEVVYDHTVQLGLYWAWSELPTVFEHRLGGLEGTRTLPAALVAADKYVSATAIYQWPFWRASWCTAVALALFEGGAYRQDGQSEVEYYGPGAGLSVYLTRVATPTIGVDVGYEMVTGTPSFSLSIGFRPTR
jgi:hypothetical protein